MTELRSTFEKAAQEAQKLPKRPDNAMMLKLYALYKQSTAGSVSGKRPGFTDPVGQAKYDAWTKVKGLTQEEAMQAYIDLVARLKG
jgi:diazepam-binding inhibitor (GABA receptor modulator, acyl-CoA-binding protein)